MSCDAEGFEIGPEIEHPLLGGPDNELTRLLGAIADRSTADALDAVTGQGDSIHVAEKLIANGGVLRAIGYATRSAECLTMFEQLGLPEDEQTAKVYADYRYQRAATLLEQTDADDPLVQAIAQEQMASPVQTEQSSMRLYSLLAEHGDAYSFEKWLRAATANFDSDEQTSEHDPYPSFNHWQELCGILHAAAERTAATDAFGKRAEIPQRRYESTMAIIDVIATAFDDTERKALFASRISGALGSFKNRSTAAVVRRARTLREQMSVTAVESSVDRDGQRVCDARLHKSAVRVLIGEAYETGRIAQLDERLQGWRSSGLLDDRDMEKIGIWRADAQRLNRPRRRRQR